MEALSQLRTLIASLDKELVECLVTRARLQRNDHLYTDTGGAVPKLDVLAGQFGDSSTLAGRVQVLRPAYLQHWRPLICEPGGNGGRTLARRLALSVHVATHKRAAIPETLQAAIKSADPAQVEKAITHPGVEREVLARIRVQALADGVDGTTADQIVALYKNWIIPLSRKIQVHGLLADS